ncbi:MAG: glycosyltransferase [Gammaproteobacteria bacterium]|nr:glycosyltransferase [Gammaproteobacteria bacterium]
MKISVIIPSWNRADRLGAALDSVYAQSVAPHEVIVVDDGSTDNTRELLSRHYLDVHTIFQQNKGVSQARNTGITAATGDWIALLDSDDRWEPGKLEQQQAAIRANPGFKLCHSDEIWIRNGKRVNPMKKHAKHGGRIFRYCLPLCVISPSTVMIHRDLFTEMGLFDETLPACEDYDLWLRICAVYPVLYVDQPLIIKVGGHADQLSRRYWGMDRFRIQALEKILAADVLGEQDHAAALETLLEKTAIMIQGAVKHDNHTLANSYREKQHKHSRTHCLADTA